MVGPEVLAKASLEYYWKSQLPLEQAEQVRQIWRLDENIYALTSSNRLLAVDAVRGRYKWCYELPGPAQKVFAPCHADDVLLPEAGGIAALLNPPDLARVTPFKGVIINTGSYALLFNRDTGGLMRKLDFDFAVTSPGSSDGLRFYVGSVKGWYHAVRLSEGLNDWTMSTGDMISARPVLFKGRLYVGSQDGNLYAVNPQASANRRLWLERTDGPITADFAVDARGCFVGSHDYRLYAYDLLTGAQLWAFRAQGPLRQPVQLGTRSLFLCADKDRFYAVDVASGRKRWDLPDGRVVVAAAEPHVFVLNAGRQLLMVNESLGQVELSLPMNGLDLFVANADKPVIFAGAADGKLACIRPVSEEKLTEFMLKD
ncbi:MAG: hypothetical protein AMJ81_09970 [Phycisphaerae bacterium SM23_33]|nr:MAG: hypothetical protein AMJ81_09970 [Phycisphaerae bacterium SM23_33]